MIPNKEKCFICNQKEVIFSKQFGDSVTQKCSKCGFFKISNTAISIEFSGHNFLQKVRGYIRRNEKLEEPTWLDSYILNDIQKSKLPSVTERADLLLRKVHQKTTYLGQKIQVLTNEFLATTYSIIDIDIRFLADYLESRELVDISSSESELSLRVSPEGYSYIENSYDHSESNSNTTFVAMCFSNELKNVWEHAIKPAITASGHIPIRIDEIHHHEKIDDQILRHIRESKFVIADLTSHRGGVYFEAGYALALGIPVIWSCKSDDFENAHFDVNHYQFIVWNDPDELRQRLEDKLIAIFGKNTYKSIS